MLAGYGSIVFSISPSHERPWLGPLPCAKAPAGAEGDQDAAERSDSASESSKRAMEDGEALVK